MATLKVRTYIVPCTVEGTMIQARWAYAFTKEQAENLVRSHLEFRYPGKHVTVSGSGERTPRADEWRRVGIVFVNHNPDGATPFILGDIESLAALLESAHDTDLATRGFTVIMYDHCVAGIRYNEATQAYELMDVQPEMELIRNHPMSQQDVEKVIFWQNKEWPL